MVDDDTSKEDTDLIVNSSDTGMAADVGPSHEDVLHTGLCQAKNIELFFRALIAEISTKPRTKTERFGNVS